MKNISNFLGTIFATAMTAAGMAYEITNPVTGILSRDVAGESGAAEDRALMPGAID